MASAGELPIRAKESLAPIVLGEALQVGAWMPIAFVEQKGRYASDGHDVPGPEAKSLRWTGWPGAGARDHDTSRTARMSQILIDGIGPVTFCRRPPSR